MTARACFMEQEPVKNKYSWTVKQKLFYRPSGAPARNCWARSSTFIYWKEHVRLFTPVMSWLVDVLHYSEYLDKWFLLNYENWIMLLNCLNYCVKIQTISEQNITLPRVGGGWLALVHKGVWIRSEAVLWGKWWRPRPGSRDSLMKRGLWVTGRLWDRRSVVNYIQVSGGSLSPL